MPPFRSSLAPRVLVTAFGAFPHMPRNPTVGVLRRLIQEEERRFARLGIALFPAVLPVSYRRIGSELARLIADVRPDVVLMLGVAGRRRRVTIETRAVNACHPLRPDVEGLYAPALLVPGGCAMLRSTIPVPRILAAVRRAGVAADPSHDAGRYLCNAALYLGLANLGSTSLGLTKATVPVGFIHIPRLRRRSSEAELSRAISSAILAAIRLRLS